MPKNRRGISSVVGALFFTVLMVAGFSVLSLALDAQTDIVTTQRVISDIELKKQQERFGIAVSTDANNFLDISVTNLGQNPVGISSFWIINKTLADAPATRYEIDYDDSFVTGGSTTQIITSQTLSMIPDTYDIKVVSSLGTIEIAELDVSPGGSSSNSLRSVMVTDPPDVILGQNVTIGMVVTNTGTLPVSNVTPQLPTANPPGAVIESSGPNLPSVDLIPGESFLFLWDYTIDGTADTDVDFSNYATGIDQNSNLVQSNVATDTSILREDASGDEGDTELIVLTQDLLAKPEIFVTIPGPFGDDGQKAVWGVNIVNPTPQSRTISKIVMTAMSSQGTGSDIIINDGSCGPVNLPVTPTGTWNCPANNQLMWKNLSTPASIPPYSAVSFLVKINPGSISGGPNASLETIPISVNVFTSLGQFGKSGYATSLDNGGAPLANVYLTDDPLNADVDANIQTSVSGIPSGSIVKLNATLTDFDTGSTQYIDQDASRLIINVPRGWTNPAILNAPGFNMQPIQTFSDGSSQIVGILSSDLSSGSEVIEFQATAPDVTSTQLYVMYILADGTTSNNDNALGPLSEVLLQVVPP